MKKIGFVLSILVLGCLAVSLNTCGGGNGIQEPTSITVAPASPTLSVGATQQFTASGKFPTAPEGDITSHVTWRSSDPSVASVNSNGLVTAIAAGTATITATSGTISGSATVTVTTATLSSIAVTPANPTIPGGVTQQFTATGTFSDGTTGNISVTWNSSNPSVATVDGNGLATAVVAGTAIITATSGTISGSTTLTVGSTSLSSIAVTPANPSISGGATQQFTATATFSDGTTHDVTTSVTWTSSNSSVATIDSSGLATAIGAGASTITATSGTISGSTTLTVSSATVSSIAVTPASPFISVGSTQQFTATGTFSDGTTRDITTQVTWSSLTLTIATVNSTGLAAAVTGGTTTITATSGTVSGNTTLTVISSPLTSITVTPANPILSAGGTQQFIATGLFLDGSTHTITAQVTWSSSNTLTATVNSSGLATAIATGTTTITATLGGTSGTTTLTVR